MRRRQRLQSVWVFAVGDGRAYGVGFMVKLDGGHLRAVTCGSLAALGATLIGAFPDGTTMLLRVVDIREQHGFRIAILEPSESEFMAVDSLECVAPFRAGQLAKARDQAEVLSLEAGTIFSRQLRLDGRVTVDPDDTVRSAVVSAGRPGSPVVITRGDTAKVVGMIVRAGRGRTSPLMFIGADVLAAAIGGGRAGSGRRRSRRTTVPAVVAAKHARGQYDVFLSFSATDLDAVRALDRRLMKRGVLPWFSERDLKVGVPWADELERQLTKIPAALVAIGLEPMRPFQRAEVRVQLVEFAKSPRPIIPVLLPGARPAGELPPFLQQFQAVDLDREEPDPIEQIIWGIQEGRRR